MIATAKRLWNEILRPLVLVAAIIFPIRSAIADWNDVPTGSMRPTIIEGDRIFVNKLAYDLKIPFTTWQVAQWDNPARGDIVVLFSPEDGERLVKRVIGVPGDVITLHEDRLYVNGMPARYLSPSRDGEGAIIADEQLGERAHAVRFLPDVPARRSFGPIIVPSGKYFVMGDNRDNSKDSRYFGFVERGEIVGRATTVVLSLNPDRYYLPRIDRFFAALD